MSKFKVGDRVRRVSNFSASLGEYFNGTPFLVQAVNDRGAVVDPTGGSHSAEFLEPDVDLPVRTRTVTEIVPGEYGPVSVRRYERDADDHVRVSLFNQDEMYRALDAAELRAAARVFVSLAEALEENQ